MRQALWALLFGLAVPVASASETIGYDKPPQNVLDVMRAPALPFPVPSPTEDAVLLVAMQEYPSIERVATPYLRLAGERVGGEDRRSGRRSVTDSSSTRIR